MKQSIDGIQGGALKRTPVLFIGHGSPMNAIADNNFTKALGNLRQLCPCPRAILCISAHWMTEGTWVTRMPRPRTIHDFYGFPESLFSIQYPAPGSPEIADLICDTVKDPKINSDDELWGLDHGTWSVLRHVFPEAKIPVLQLSLDLKRSLRYHFELGQKIRSLRDQGILIVGSGNIVHNLRTIKWEANAAPSAWAMAFDEWIKGKLLERSFDPIIDDFAKTEDGRMSVPTSEHYLPLLYTLGASDVQDELHFEYEEIQNGSISMRTMSFSSRP